MKQFFWLLQDNLPLAAAEATALSRPKYSAQLGDILVVYTQEKGFHNRLALSRATYTFLFSCHVKDLHKKMQDFKWQKHYKRSFKLEVHHSPIPSRELAEYIWNSLKNPKVDMDNPNTIFELFFQGTTVIAGKRLATIDPAPFFKRRPHLRTVLHPSGMQPRLARALVNLTRAKKGTIVDPFCGTGGILIEAGLMGLKIVGYDKEESMIEKAEKTLDSFKLKAKLKVADATKLTKSMQFVATDLPYGRNTKAKELEKLYLAFLKKLKKLLIRRAVVVFPHFINHKKLIEMAKLDIIGEYRNYVHSTLSRTIVVLEA